MNGKKSSFSLEYTINGQKHEYHGLSRSGMLTMAHRLAKAGIDYKVRKEKVEVDTDNENH